MEIKNEKYQTYLQTIADNSIDFVCIDPPYTDKKGNDVLKGHKIQTKIDICHVVSEAYRVAKDNSFFAIFGQMPSIVDWHLSALQVGFEFKEDITWVKGQVSSPMQKITRQKELIYIYIKGNSKFKITKGAYENVALPRYLYGMVKIESLNRYILDLKYKLKNGISLEEANIKSKRLTNDKIYKNNISSNRSPDKCNFTNVWVFTPENKINKNSNNTKHPTVKSIKLLERLIELCTPEPTKENKPIVLDYFLGSGTTAIASVNTNRDFKGCEMDKIYYDTEIIPRVNKAIQKHNSDMFQSAEFGVYNCL